MYCTAILENPWLSADNYLKPKKTIMSEHKKIYPSLIGTSRLCIKTKLKKKSIEKAYYENNQTNIKIRGKHH